MADKKTISQAVSELACQHPKVVQRHLKHCCLKFKDLTPKACSPRYYMMYDIGKELLEYKMIRLAGTIPMPYKGATYNTPVSIWMHQDYPNQAPIVMVIPNKGMKVKPSKLVDDNGQISLPYLTEWKQGYDLLSLVNILCIEFGSNPPLYNDNRPSPVQAAEIPNTSYNQPPSQPYINGDTKAQIRGLPDLSRFVKRGEKLPVHNIVLLVVGEESIEVSGPVISQVSDVLQELVGRQAELYLDQFVGEIEGIQDVVEMLYGGVVELSEKNYRTIMKFSLLYKIHDMYALCREWVKKNIVNLDLYKLIQFGLQLERIDADSKDVSELCIDMIFRDGFGKDWVIGSFGADVNFVKFLIQEIILGRTLPLITSWLSTDCHINTILTELEDKALVETLWKYGEHTTAMFEKMSETVTVLETCKKLNKIKDRNYRNFVSNNSEGMP